MNHIATRFRFDRFHEWDEEPLREEMLAEPPSMFINRVPLDAGPIPAEGTIIADVFAELQTDRAKTASEIRLDLGLGRQTSVSAILHKLVKRKLAVREKRAVGKVTFRRATR